MPRVTHRQLLAVVGVLVLATVVGAAVLWPRSVPDIVDSSDVQQTDLIDATILEVQLVAGAEDPDVPELVPGSVEVLITAEFDDTGEVVEFQTSDDTGGTFAAGQRVRLAMVSSPGQPPIYYVQDFQRSGALGVLLALFLLAVMAFGRLQGLRALVGLGLSFMVIVGFIVPAILANRSPVAVALVGSFAVMIFTLYLSHGLRPKTTAAVVGTAGALLLTVGLATLFVELANLTGFSSEDARLANVSVGGLNLQGLLLAGIIVGGLGVLDDVTMSQSSTVFELARANPQMRPARLVRSALNVGRDHIAATVNTLFLAYAGAALPLLLLFATGIDPFGTVVTSEIVAVEVVRTLVGSIGLIAAVPFTTALAATLAADRTGRHLRGDPSVQVDPSTKGSGSDSAGFGARASTEPPDPDTAGDSAGAGAGDSEWERQLRESYGLGPPEA